MRGACAFVLVLVATLVAPLVITTSWLTARVDDQQAYVDTVAPLADDPHVRELMARVAADEAVAAVQQHIPLAVPAQLTDWARAAARMVVESPEFPRFWREANARLHRDALRLLRDPDARAEGHVMVDASPLVGQVLLSLEDRGIPVGLLPEVPLYVPVAPESRLVEVADQYRAADVAARWLPVVWAGLVLLAVLVASGWRGRLRTLGFALLGVALAAVVVLLAVDPVTEIAADRAQVGREELTGLMLDVVLGSLTPYARGFLLAAPVGLLLVVGSLWRRPHPESPDSPAHAEFAP